MALIIACVIYSGQPEALILFGLCLLLFIVVLLVQRLPLLGGSRPVLRPALDISVATVAGLALGACHSLLPGLQLLVGCAEARSSDSLRWRPTISSTFCSRDTTGCP